MGGEEILDKTSTSNKTFQLKEDIEREFFKTIFGGVKEIDSIQLYRYTSFSSFVRILEKMEHTMCSLSAMNDATESKYCEEYILKRLQKNGSNKQASAGTVYNKLYFITSLMPKDNFDNLDMWRIYGDDGRGVMLEYEVQPSSLQSDHILAQVLYETTKGSNGAIKFFYDLMKHKFENNYHIELRYWETWQHMFKPFEYRNEREIRLLCASEKADKWVLNTNYNILMPIKLLSIDSKCTDVRKKYPLTLKRVFLGPKMAEKETNMEMLQFFFKEKNCNIGVEESTIFSYR